MVGATDSSVAHALRDAGCTPREGKPETVCEPKRCRSSILKES